MTDEQLQEYVGLFSDLGVVMTFDGNHVTLRERHAENTLTITRQPTGTWMQLELALANYQLLKSLLKQKERNNG